MAVIKHPLTKTAAPPYNADSPTPLWLSAELIAAEIANGDTLLLTQLPDKCLFGADSDAPALGLAINIVTGGALSTFANLILCDEDGGNPVDLGTLDDPGTKTVVDFTTLEAEDFFYDAGGRYLALDFTTAPTTDGVVNIGGMFATGTKKFSA